MTLRLPLARDKERRGSDHDEEVSVQARFINREGRKLCLAVASQWRVACVTAQWELDSGRKLTEEPQYPATSQPEALGCEAIWSPGALARLLFSGKFNRLNTSRLDGN